MESQTAGHPTPYFSLHVHIHVHHTCIQHIHTPHSHNQSDTITNIFLGVFIMDLTELMSKDTIKMRKEMVLDHWGSQNPPWNVPSTVQSWPMILPGTRLLVAFDQSQVLWSLSFNVILGYKTTWDPYNPENKSGLQWFLLGIHSELNQNTRSLFLMF